MLRQQLVRKSSVPCEGGACRDTGSSYWVYEEEWHQTTSVSECRTSVNCSYVVTVIITVNCELYRAVYFHQCESCAAVYSVCLVKWLIVWYIVQVYVNPVKLDTVLMPWPIIMNVNVKLYDTVISEMTYYVSSQTLISTCSLVILSLVSFATQYFIWCPFYVFYYLRILSTT